MAKKRKTARDFLPTFGRRKVVSAYDVGVKVIEAVKEEPLRLDMGDWGIHFKSQRAFIAERGWGMDPVAPACATQACLGGWVGMLVKGRITEGEEAVKIMTGTTPDNLLDECGDKRADGLIKVFLNIPRNAAGTPAHVDAAVRKFRRWLQKHRAFLMKRQVQISARARR